VIALATVTPDGFPLAYEMLPGNRADCTTLHDALRKIEFGCRGWLRLGGL
jgi:hypothetical protein